MAIARGKVSTTIHTKVYLELTVAEAMALEAITKYGHRAFLQGYYEQLGKSYLEPHEKGVISLFNTIKETLPSELKMIERVYDSITQIHEEIYPTKTVIK